jgi:hypothetical protein
MQKIEQAEAVRKNWLLDKWYEKTIYVFGVIYTVLLVLSFVVGFIAEL